METSVTVYLDSGDEFGIEEVVFPVAAFQGATTVGLSLP